MPSWQGFAICELIMCILFPILLPNKIHLPYLHAKLTFPCQIEVKIALFKEFNVFITPYPLFSRNRDTSIFPKFWSLQTLPLPNIDWKCPCGVHSLLCTIANHYQTHTSTWTFTLFWLWGALMPMNKHITFIHEQVMFNFHTKIFKVECSDLGYACLVTSSNLFVYQLFNHQQVFDERWFYPTPPKSDQAFTCWFCLFFVQC